jgi:hypothetical protein
MARTGKVAENVGEVEFSLVDCGPCDRILGRIGLRQPGAPHLVRRALILALITWLPLLLMAVLSGGGQPAVPFLKDIAVHVRFLLAAPALIIAEGVIGHRTRLVVVNFLVSGLVTEKDRPAFHAALHRGRRLLDSSLAEAVLLIVSYTVVWLAVRAMKADGSVFWFEKAAPTGEQLSILGWWYALSAPIVVFLFLRWGWRYGIWCWFLWRVSRLDLRIIGTHPDRAGGLGFVSIGQNAFATIAFAASCVVSGAAITRVLYRDVPFKSLQTPIIGFIVCAVLLGLVPLFVFWRPLAAARRRGLFQFGSLASHYVQSFDEKWIEGGAGVEDVLLGSSDIQSLADLGGSFEHVTTMRPFPFGKGSVIAFALAAGLPMLPLLMTQMPLREILKVIVQAMF